MELVFIHIQQMGAFQIQLELVKDSLIYCHKFKIRFKKIRMQQRLHYKVKISRALSKPNHRLNHTLHTLNASL